MRTEHQSENPASCTNELLGHRIRARAPNQCEDGGIAGPDHVAHLRYDIVGDSVFFLPGTRVAGARRGAGHAARRRANPKRRHRGSAAQPSRKGYGEERAEQSSERNAPPGAITTSEMSALISAQLPVVRAVDRNGVVEVDRPLSLALPKCGEHF
jgi:hypothetical protein